LGQAGNLNAGRFLNRRHIERTLADERKKQGGCTGLGIHPETTEDLTGFGAAIHRRVDAFILGKPASDQHSSASKAVRVGVLNRRLEPIA
jgi:hypothetical protein